jgi:hypothetical protein
MGIGSISSVIGMGGCCLLRLMTLESGVQTVPGLWTVLRTVVVRYSAGFILDSASKLSSFARGIELIRTGGEGIVQAKCSWPCTQGIALLCAHGQRVD